MNEKTALNLYDDEPERQSNEHVLLGKQALNIDKLQTQNDILNKQLGEIQNIILAIGGPLNDNKLKLSVRQQCIFHDIIAIIER